MEFENKIIFFDENKKAELLRPHEMSLEYFQNIIDEYNKLEIVDLQKNDLIQLIENPKKFIAESIVKDENLSFGNLKLKFESLYEIIEKPTGTEELINKINNDKNDRNTVMFYHASTTFLEVENGKKVVISENTKNQITENSTVYLKSKVESEIYDSLQEVAKIYKKLQKYQFKEKHLKDLLFDGFIQLDQQNNVNINPYFAKFVNQ